GKLPVPNPIVTSHPINLDVAAPTPFAAVDAPRANASEWLLAKNPAASRSPRQKIRPPRKVELPAVVAGAAPRAFAETALLSLRARQIPRALDAYRSPRRQARPRCASSAKTSNPTRDSR